MLLLCSDGYLTQKEFWCIPDAVIQSGSRKRFSTNLAIHIEKHQRWPPFLPFFQSSYPTEQLSQEKISYSKSTIKTLEKNIKCLYVSQKRYQNNVTVVVLVSLLLTLNILHTFFWCFYCWLLLLPRSTYTVVILCSVFCKLFHECHFVSWFIFQGKSFDWKFFKWILNYFGGKELNSI